MTTMYDNSMAKGNVMSQSHQSMMRQYIGGHFQQQQQHQHQEQLYRQPITNVESIVNNNPLIGNTQPRNAMSTSVAAQASEIIDLTSPTSNPELSAIPPPLLPLDTVTRSAVSWKLHRIPERPWQTDTSNSVAYKVNNIK